MGDEVDILYRKVLNIANKRQEKSVYYFKIDYVKERNNKIMIINV